ncbi:MAG: hypothetical protein L6Q98_09140 [Anaerolineae bacterium]|nr:hypothetical protein [Anaerolineae bacterium]NUQ06053.1 hypothetical protein [Anaerolineae bacterium]
MNQESRTLLAITFLLAALFVAMNRIVESAPLLDYWLALALFLIGAVLALSSRYDLARGLTHEEVAAQVAAAPALPRVQVYEFPAGAARQINAAAAPLPIDDAPAAQSSAPDLALGAVIIDEPAPPPVEGDNTKESGDGAAG